MLSSRIAEKGWDVTDSPTTRAAIAGIGATEFSKDSGRSELRLAVEAAMAAADDAGCPVDSIDGLVTFTMDNNEEQAVARALGLPRVNFFARTPNGGGGACGAVALATMAIATGRASAVLCYRAMNERSQQRFGAPQPTATGQPTSWDLDMSWCLPQGLATPAAWMSMSARRYMIEYGATSEDFGRVAVAARAYAAVNPSAWFYGKPITLEDHQQSRLIADPLHLLDCCQESDGAVAILVTSEERAKDLRTTPVHILAAEQAIGPEQVGMATLYREDLTWPSETAIVSERLWSRCDLSPDDIDVTILYDHFTPAILMQLEAFGYCGRGEAKDLIRDRGIGPGGTLPLNTHGGQLGEAYIHGFNGIAEATRQLRGSAVSQVAGARTALVSSGSHVPTSGLVLGVDR